MSLRVVGSLALICLVGCGGGSKGGASGPGDGVAGDGEVSSAGKSANGGSSATGGSSSTTAGSAGEAGGGTDSGGMKPMGAGGAEGGTNESGLGGEGGTDMTDLCIGVVCKSPPGPVCDGTTALKSYDATGSCTDGTCSYVSHSIACDCENGACDTDPCLSVTCATPPAANCKDATHLVTYTDAGTCAAGSCSYPGTEKLCDFGCNGAACNANPCASVTCNQPPATACKDANTKVAYAVSGTCSEGDCSYASTETACNFGCDQGNCLPDPCLAVTCDAPPSPSCESPTQLRTYDKVGSCTGGSCDYTSRLIACNCQNNACAVDPCQSVTCDSPPAAACKDPATLTSYAKSGTCKAGSCSYTASDKACTFGCENGACKADPCTGISCNQPPASICKDANTKTTYAAKGSCSAGNCAYTATNSPCAFGCENGACKADPCAGVTCNQPPAATCKDPSTKTTYAGKGSCSAGNCGYTATDAVCAFGCQNGACNPDPCAGVTCNQPPTALCKDDNTKTTYAATGTCSDGDCSYKSTNTACGSNKLCEGDGICSVCSADDACGANCTACSGNTPKCKLTGQTSECVACVTDLDCDGANPKCNTATNVCGPQPSCIGLADTCGPNGDQDCCASGLVSGGTFNRSDDPKYPATVSDFRLDNYEITVGRFRKFLAVYQKNMTPGGAGRNPNNPNDTGWNADWNYDMPADQATLKALLKCNGGSNISWQDTPGDELAESLPIMCVGWLVAEAFCIWDGGRLPTDAEWNYAASGGNEQRKHPWGSAAADCAHANSGTEPCGDRVNRVGSESPLGDGRYGQSDLAGNVWELTQDVIITNNLSLDPYYSNTTCNDCAQLSSSYDERVMWGGGFLDDLSQDLPQRGGGGNVYYGSWTVGARCARMP